MLTKGSAGAGKGFGTIAIADQAANTGVYTWKIPGSVRTGKNYKIKVVSNTTPELIDTSDSYFKIY